MITKQSKESKQRILMPVEATLCRQSFGVSATPKRAFDELRPGFEGATPGFIKLGVPPWIPLITYGLIEAVFRKAVIGGGGRADESVNRGFLP